MRCNIVHSNFVKYTFDIKFAISYAKVILCGERIICIDDIVDDTIIIILHISSSFYRTFITQPDMPPNWYSLTWHRFYTKSVLDPSCTAWHAMTVLDCCFLTVCRGHQPNGYYTTSLPLDNTTYHICLILVRFNILQRKQRGLGMSSDTDRKAHALYLSHLLLKFSFSFDYSVYIMRCNISFLYALVLKVKCIFLLRQISAVI